jgi:lipopolysaccharide/colanic/teichoic acid biosynthesis glycosyltransferase
MGLRMTMRKRIFDIGLALLLIAVLSPLFVILVIALLIVEGRPLFYISERMKTPTQGFALIKLRTMANVANDAGVTGGDKTARIGRVHRLLRRTRLDELPQLWNVLKGDMSFVGPRPPLRVYVWDYPAIYGQVLQNRPGITGLASLRFHAHEETLLSRCATSAQTDEVYRRRCIPRKAALDLIYRQHQSFCFDLALIGETAQRLLRR